MLYKNYFCPTLLCRGCGRRTRTSDLLVMSQVSYQLLYSAMSLLLMMLSKRPKLRPSCLVIELRLQR